MKKEMSSFDVRSIVSEMNALEGSHMDKIFQWGTGNVLFRFNVQGEGKRDLFFKDKTWLYMPPEKPDTPITPTSFATFLRKYLDNARIGRTVQANFDRIAIMDVFKAEKDYKLIFEMYGGGNVLLVLEDVIVNCLIHKTRRDRSTRPGEPYSIPQSRFDPTSATLSDFMGTFRSSESDTVRTLATVVNLGGQYAEEVCKRASVNKGAPSSEMSDEDIGAMHSTVHEIMDLAKLHNEPTTFLKDGKIVDLAPFKLSIHDDKEFRSHTSMSLAIHEFLKSISDDKEKEFKDPEIEKLKKRIMKQRETYDEYLQQSDALRVKADRIYEEYAKVNDLLNVLFEQSKKLTWDRLKEGAMKIPYVISIDPSRDTVVCKLGDEDVPLNYTKGLDANASDIYQRGKDIGDKGRRAEDALKESMEELERKQKGFDKARALALAKVQPTKQFWFERYKWFITSSGKLVVAGRDAHTNDNVVKKHLKEKDVFAHADVHGAPSIVFKEGLGAPPEDLREACIFAITQSKAWVASMVEGSAFWVYPDQVSKTPNAGEFVPRGAFIVRGKRNYEHHLTMQLGVGEITYMNERKVMCGPLNLFEGCERYFIIKPGKSKSGRQSGPMAKDFNVPEEEISRILPPGDVEIIERIWKEGSTEDDE